MLGEWVSTLAPTPMPASMTRRRIAAAILGTTRQALEAADHDVVESCLVRRRQ
jgi:hypothetical protein